MNSKPYTVHIYEGEASLIGKWTLQCPNVETGGDLFGHWINEDEIVIEAVLCQNPFRTSNSFSQDEQYLRNVEELTNDHGLCNIGSWHSYSMNISEDTCEDVDTVWRHQPTPGKFLLLVATIDTETGSPKVQMDFNLYETTRKEYKVIPISDIEILPREIPIGANEQTFEGSRIVVEGHSSVIFSSTETSIQCTGKPEQARRKCRYETSRAGSRPTGSK